MGQLNLFGADDRRPTLREIWAEDAATLPAARVNSTVEDFDVARLSGALRRLFEHMRDGAWHAGPSLIPVAGLRYGARLEELKRAGCPFAKDHVGEGVWRYRLVASPTNGVGENCGPQ